MEIYESVPHEIEAFKFVVGKSSPPDWLINAVKVGKALVTLGGEDKNYVTIIGKTKTQKAFEGDYICRNYQENIFVLPEKDFEKLYRRVADDDSQEEEEQRETRKLAVSS